MKKKWLNLAVLWLLTPGILTLPASAQQTAAAAAPQLAASGPCSLASPDFSSSKTASFVAQPERSDSLPCASLVSFQPRGAGADPIVEPAIQPTERRVEERFHWQPALKQSLEFLLLEHAVRIGSDSYARYLLLHKPFWHDYMASLGDTDMQRWGDGDDFLINYIGHPLQGAVSGYIEVQNDPKGRTAKFGKNRTYWMSRLRAMAWSAAYSAEFEFGPLLSETAIGNQGGYSYIPGCGLYPTCDKVPGKRYKPPTNNTGWVDSVVTPTIGTGWLVLEDLLEAKVVDRVAGDSHAVKYKVLRGTLAPARSMANMLAGHLPWYRPSPADDRAPTMLAEAFVATPQVRPAWTNEPRRELGIHFAGLDMPLESKGCGRCRTFQPGIGFDFNYRLTRLVYFDSEYDFFPEHGMTQKALFGLRFGRRFGPVGLFTQVRPGFIHYSNALVPGTTDKYDSVNRLALDLGGTAEYYASQHATLRLRMGTTFVRYKTDYADPNQPPTSVLADSFIVTQGHMYVSSGYVVRF